MPKQDSVVTYLLLLLAVGLLIAAPFAYDYFDTKYYAGHGDAWKEFWLPALCSLEAALIAIVVAMCFLRRVEKSAADAQTEAVAARVVELIEDRLTKMRSDAYQDAIIEILTRLKLPTSASFPPAFNLPDDASNKESTTSRKPQRRTAPNKEKI